jgi:hypothetical protein
LPDLIPLRHLVVNKETKFNYRISPDGRKLGWIAVKGGRLTIHLKQIDGDKVSTLTPAAPGNIFGFVWTPDSSRILYWQDQSGNENYHISWKIFWPDTWAAAARGSICTNSQSPKSDIFNEHISQSVLNIHLQY